MSASCPYVIAPVELIVLLYKDSWKKTSGSRKSDITRDEFVSWTKVSKLNLLIDIIILQYAFVRFVGYFHILCLDFPLTDILYLF